MKRERLIPANALQAEPSSLWRMSLDKHFQHSQIE